jgi:hypothetical protein
LPGSAGNTRVAATCADAFKAGHTTALHREIV